MIWLALLACLIVSFTFSGIEYGVLSVNRVRLRHYARRGEEAAQKLDSLLTRIERLMVTVVIITNTANILAVTLLFWKFTEWMGAAGAIAVLAVSLPVFIFGLEFLPKAIFRRFPYRTLVIFARILTATYLVMAPLLSLGAWILRPLFRRQREAVSGRIVAVEDLNRLLAESEAKGQLTAGERALINHVVEFRTVLAGDLMIPMKDAPKVRPETEVRELLKLARETDVDRFLVVGDDRGVRGLIRSFDLLLDGVTSGRAQSYVRRVVTVRAHEKALEALRKLRAARLSMATVVDAEGRPVGVLTSEQLVRRLLAGQK